MTTPDQDYLAVATAIQRIIRERPAGQTAIAAMADGLRGLEGLIGLKWVARTRELDASIVDTFAELERYKGAGTMLRKESGDPEATEELIRLFTWRYNLAKEIAVAIRSGRMPELPTFATGGQPQ